MKIFKSLHHKILLVFAFCASITLLGFFAVYFLSSEQQHSLKKQLEIPPVSINWFKLNNGILKSTLAQQSYLYSRNKIFLKERNLVWDKEIDPTFKHLGKLYKKSRIWTEKRAVERRAFYDLRLMILDLKNIQQKYSNLVKNKISEKSLIDWSKLEKPLVNKIIKQIELIVRWQTDFAKQRTSELHKVFSELGIWIWMIASIVLILVLTIALFFAKKISAPLRELRSEINQVIREQKIIKMNSDLNNQQEKETFHFNEDEVQKLTESFREMEAVIAERTKLLENSNLELNKSNHAKGMYLTNMSHELRTPLNAIIGFTEILIDTNEDEPLSDYKKDRLTRILKSGRHLLELINSLLDLSKIEAGQMEIVKKDFLLKTLLEDIMESLEPLLNEKSLKHKIFLEAEEKLLLFSDSAKVRQVLINLIGNAIKFTDSGGIIHIKCYQNKKEVFIAIKDTGCGISDKQKENIFRVFHQVKSSSDSEGKIGTGLGLALVHSLMKLLGGSVSLESKFGEGSTFTIHFPVQNN